MKKIITLLLTLTFFNGFAQSDYFWIGGTGNWNDLTHWSTTSGGTDLHIQQPTSLDDVYFDANSFDATGQTVTVNVPQIYLNSMTWAGAVNNPTFSNGYTMNISGSLTLINEMTYNGGTTKFNSTEIGNTITSVGNNIGNITFDGVGGEWGLQDATIFNNLTLNNGGFSTNNFDLSFTAYGKVSSSNSNVRSLDLGTSTVTLASVMNVAWNTTNTTNLTFDGADSTLILTGYIADCCGNYFIGGGLTFGNISFTGTGVGSTPGWYLQGDNTFNNVSFAANGYLEGNQTINDLTLAAGYVYTVVAGTTQTILGDINAVGTCINGITIKSNNTSQATITKSNGAVTAEYIDLSNIIGTGGATYTANNSVDGGGNTGWTINTLAPTNFDLHWIGGNGNWGDGSNWSTTSGGAAYGCIPSSTDNVIFDANSFDATGQTVTVNVPQIYLNSMTWAGAVNNPTFSNGYTMNISGSLTLINEMTYNGGTTKFNSTEIGNTITSVGNNIGNITFDGVGGEWGLQDATIFNNLTLNNGGFSTNNFDLSFTAYGKVSSSNSNVRSLDLGTSTVTLASVMNVAWNTTNTTNLTFDGADSTLILTGYIADCCGNYFIGGGLTFGNISFTGTGVGSTPGWYLQGDNTFNNVSFAANGYLEGNQTINDLTLAAGYVYTVVAGTTQTILGDINAVGTCINGITIKSNNTSQATITKSNGAVTAEYIDLSNIIGTGGATYTANNSVDGGGNTGWTINTLAPTNFDLHWIGGNGNWGDGSNWSTTSGGAAYGCIPSSTDNVIFDANSFDATGQTVTVNVPQIYLNSMTWAGAVNNPTFSNGYTMNISGSLTLINEMTYNGGTTKFNSTEIGNTITSVGNNIGNITFDGVGGEWGLQDATIFNNLTLNNGGFSTNNFDLSFTAYGKVSSSNSNVRSLDLGTSTVTLASVMNVAWNTTNTTNLTFDGADSTLILTGYIADCCGNYFIGGGLTFGNISFTGTGVGSTPGWYLQGDNTFNNVSFAANGYLEGNQTINDLTLAAGYVYTIVGGTNQTINGAFNATGISTDLITIKSNNTTQATLTGAGTYCMDYLNMEYMTTSGGGTFNAGINSTHVLGNSGFIYTDTCVPEEIAIDTTVPVITLLGNDPETVEVGATYADAGATALDNVDGNITTSIVVVNPVDTAIVGAYTVTYNVSDAAGNAAVEVTRTVNVVDTTVPVITLLGNDSETVEVGATYADAGATALDNVDGNITPSIVVVNPVNTAIADAYTVTYNVSDAAGNTAVQVTRTVNVVDTTVPAITLLGNDPVSIEVGATYADAGATALDNVDGNITPSIVVVNPVDTAIVGAYTITYNVSDAAGNAAVEVTRTVNVLDITIPVITRLGDDPVSIEVGETYVDAGATASDNVDGVITTSIVVVNPVNTAIADEYTITYNVSDAAGNAAVQVTRTVNVVETLGLDSTDLNKVSVYPNPTASKWTIESSRIINTLTLFNLLGQKVLEQTANEMKVSIDASNLKTGVYMLKINTTTIKRVLKR